MSARASSPPAILIVVREMPSRKRAKGEARKAKKKDDLSGCQGKCTHMAAVRSKHHICRRFIVQLDRELRSLCRRQDETNSCLTIAAACSATIKRLQESNQFNEVFNKESIQKKLLPRLLGVGTDCLLKDDYNEYYSMLASVIAVTALFCQHNFNEDDILASEDFGIYRDIIQGSLGYNTIKFFAKRVSCNCLKKMNSRAKTGPKTKRREG